MIDPETHAQLIALQREVHKRFAELETYDGDNPEREREKVREAVTEKEKALHASGLVEEHGYYRASQDLKQAARDAEATEQK